jgi:hypothetical protein
MGAWFGFPPTGYGPPISKKGGSACIIGVGLGNQIRVQVFFVLTTAVEAVTITLKCNGDPAGKGYWECNVDKSFRIWNIRIKNDS